jgi:hypothetical protein
MKALIIGVIALLIGGCASLVGEPEEGVYIGKQTEQLYLRTDKHTYVGLDDGHQYRKLVGQPWLKDLNTGQLHSIDGQMVDESPSR